MREEDFLNRLGEQEKKIKEEYLCSLKVLKSKYDKEEEVIQIEGRSRNHEGDMEKQSVELLEQIVAKLGWKEESLRREIEGVREEIKRLGKEAKPVRYKLGE